MAMTDEQMTQIWVAGTGYWHSTRDWPKPAEPVLHHLATGCCFKDAMRNELLRQLLPG